MPSLARYAPASTSCSPPNAKTSSSAAAIAALVQRRDCQEAQHCARLQPIHPVGDVLCLVELLEREGELGIAELELHHHILSLRRLVGYAQITRRENDSVELHEIGIAHRFGQSCHGHFFQW